MTNTPDSRARFALFNLGFRPFYLLAGTLAAVSVPLWLAQYSGVLSTGSHLGGFAWHAHEMVFGFAAAVIAGFLFTAARNWTNLPTPMGGPLAALALLWLAGRVLVYTGPAPIAAAVDVAFLPAVAIALWFPLYRSGNRNLFFVGLLLLFALANLAFHLAHAGWFPLPAHAQIRFALYLVVLIVTIMGGRVIPLFTGNALRHARVRVSGALDRAVIALTVLALASDLTFPGAALTGLICLSAAVAHGARLWRWDPFATRGAPIVWILHLSYAWIPVGFLLLALSSLGAAQASLAAHAFGVGAVGGMILGMMTRTARGHSGRPLQAGPLEVAAYALVQIAAVIRVFGTLLFPDAYVPLLVTAGMCWSAAFTLYLIVYVPILTQPRIDGRPG